MADKRSDENTKGKRMDDIRKRALRLYRPPFKYEGGYIWDAKGEMVADGNAEGLTLADDPATVRVRGWGRIGYEKDSEALYDAVGEEIAAALTAHWQKRKEPA